MKEHEICRVGSTAALQHHSTAWATELPTLRRFELSVLKRVAGRVGSLLPTDIAALQHHSTAWATELPTLHFRLHFRRLFQSKIPPLNTLIPPLIYLSILWDNTVAPTSFFGLSLKQEKKNESSMPEM
jgi:hypothetical protein